MKFGGSSVKNAAAMQRVGEIIKKHIERKPLVVVSALGGVTDRLIEALEQAEGQNPMDVEKIVVSLERRHLNLIDDLLQNSKYAENVKQLVLREIGKLRVLLNATEAIRAQSKRITNAVLSVGEVLSSHILSAYFNKRGLHSACADARQFMVVSYHGDEVVPHLDSIKQRATKHLQSYFDRYAVTVTQGFIAVTGQGAPATLGRDGSDYTASLLGAALGSEEIQIWSDVDGILTADPSIVADARPLKNMTFDEACELAYFGARVLHPAAIQPALENGIPVRVLNSSRPQEEGTLILSENTHPDEENGSLIKSIAYKENITLLTIDSSHLLLSPRVMEQIFMSLYRLGKRVYAVSKSATKVSITIENGSDQEELIRELSKQGRVHIEPKKVIVTVVGEQMRPSHELSWQIIRMLDEASICIELISQFADQISLTFIVDESDIERTVRLLHKRLIKIQ